MRQSDSALRLMKSRSSAARERAKRHRFLSSARTALLRTTRKSGQYKRRPVCECDSIPHPTALQVLDCSGISSGTQVRNNLILMSTPQSRRAAKPIRRVAFRLTRICNQTPRVEKMLPNGL